MCATEQTSSTPFGLHRGVDIPEDFDAKKEKMLSGEGQFYPPKSSIFEETYIRDYKNGEKEGTRRFQIHKQSAWAFERCPQ